MMFTFYEYEMSVSHVLLLYSFAIRVYCEGKVNFLTMRNKFSRHGEKGTTFVGAQKRLTN